MFAQSLIRDARRRSTPWEYVIDIDQKIRWVYTLLHKLSWKFWRTDVKKIKWMKEETFKICEEPDVNIEDGIFSANSYLNLEELVRYYN